MVTISGENLNKNDDCRPPHKGHELFSQTIFFTMLLSSYNRHETDPDWPVRLIRTWHGGPDLPQRIKDSDKKWVVDAKSMNVTHL